MNSLYENLKEKNISFSDAIPKGASYIMGDGLFLDLLASKEIVVAKERADKTYVTHPQFVDYLVRAGLIDKRCEKPLLDSDNAIAINDGTNYIKEAAYICLPFIEPSTEQFESLLNWLTNLMSISPVVQIETKNKVPVIIYDFVSLENDNGWTPEKIIENIKQMYIEEER